MVFGAAVAALAKRRVFIPPPVAAAMKKKQIEEEERWERLAASGCRRPDLCIAFRRGVWLLCSDSFLFLIFSLLHLRSSQSAILVFHVFTHCSSQIAAKFQLALVHLFVKKPPRRTHLYHFTSDCCKTPSCSSSSGARKAARRCFAIVFGKPAT